MSTALEKYQALQVSLEHLLDIRDRCERKIKALDRAWNQHPYFEGNRPSRATLDRENERLAALRLRGDWEEQLRLVAAEMTALAPAVDAEERAQRAS